MAFEIYPLAFPSSVDAGTIFPTEGEVSSGRAGSGINVSGTLAGTPLTDISTRPNDWGRRLMSDLDDGPVVSELDNISLVESIPRPNVGTFPIPAFPELLEDLESDIPVPAPRLTRDVYYGLVIEKVNASQYRVVTQIGFLVVGTQFRPLAVDNIVPNTPVVVVRGNQPDEWYIQAESFKPAVRIVTVRGIREDFLECETEEGDGLKVARSFEFWGSLYRGKDAHIPGHTYEMVSFTRRRVIAGESSTVLQIINDGYYSVGDRITVGYAPFGIESTVDGTCEYIDLNLNGFHWATELTITGKVTELTTLTGEYDDVEVEINEDSGRLIIVRCPFAIAGDKLEENARVVATWQPLMNRYVLTNVFTYAKKFIGTLNDPLWSTASTVEVSVTKYWDGISPGATLTVNNSMGWAGNEDNIVVCERTRDGDYEITQRLKHDGPELINFVLTGDLNAGSAGATFKGVTSGSGGSETTIGTGTVYDPRGIFTDGVTGDEGIAQWRYDMPGYQVIQLSCGGGA